MKKITLILALIIILFVLASCGKTDSDDVTEAVTEAVTETDTVSESSAETNEIKTYNGIYIDRTFGAFSTLDLNGKGYDETMFRENKLTLVNFCATWCDPCASEMSALGELAVKYKDKVGFVAIVVDIPVRGGDTSKVAELSAKAYNAFPFLLASNDIMNGIGANATTLPTTYFVDENGNVLDGPYIGARRADAWASIIDNYLLKIN